MYAVSVRLKIITEHTARPGPSKAFLKPLVIYQYNIIQYITLHYITLHYITLHYITLHYITLHYITLHYITLHYNTYIFLKAHKNTADS